MDTDVIRSAARAIEGNAAAIGQRPNDWPDEILNRVRIQWNDETYDVDWSQMKTSELVMGAGALRVIADEQAYGPKQAVADRDSNG